jgi:hypothetical protein
LSPLLISDSASPYFLSSCSALHPLFCPCMLFSVASILFLVHRRVPLSLLYHRRRLSPSPIISIFLSLFLRSESPFVSDRRSLPSCICYRRVVRTE